MPLDDGIKNLMSIGEHAVGEEEGGGVVRAGRVRDEKREEGGNGVDFVTWSREERKK